MKVTQKHQSGMMLLEALLGILIFSIGILAMVAMQARSVSTLADAQYRVEAVNLANRLLSQIWVNADRSNAAALQTSLLTFAHQAGGTPCDFNGDPASSPVATAWLNMVQKPLLPGADNPAYQQILVQPVIGTATVNRVTITLCWRSSL